MAQIIYHLVNRNYGYYEFTIKMTEKSIIMIERSNFQGNFDKEIRYRKDDRILQDIEWLKRNEYNFGWFEDNYLIYNNKSYWQSWRKIY